MTSIDTTQRDELALDIFLADNSSISEGKLRQDWSDAPDRHRPYAQNIADGLIAKGYRKPRTVLTGAELDALPAGAVILGRDGAACQKEEIPGLWGSAGELFSTDFVALPATVLHEPEAEATR